MDDLLVAARRGLYLVRDGEARRLVDGDHYGITWDRERLYLAHRKGARIVTWDGQGDYETVECPWRQNDVHQLLWWDGVLYVMASGADQVDAWDGQTWRVLWKGTGDGSEHANSIWCDGLDQFWVVEHRFGRVPARIRVYNRGFSLITTYEFHDLAQAHNCGLHNAYVEDGRLVTLSVHRMILHDLINGTEGRWTFGGYLRGLARTRHSWYIGQSIVAERQDRAEGDGEVLVLDNRFQVATSIHIPGAGQVHDIRALRGDWAHNGLECPVEVGG